MFGGRPPDTGARLVAYVISLRSGHFSDFGAGMCTYVSRCLQPRVGIDTGCCVQLGRRKQAHILASCVVSLCIERSKGL